MTWRRDQVLLRLQLPAQGRPVHPGPDLRAQRSSRPSTPASGSGSASRVPRMILAPRSSRRIFKLPLSVSEITMEILRVPCVAGGLVSGPRQQLAAGDGHAASSGAGLCLRVGREEPGTSTTPSVYPIVAKQLQIRITRSSGSHAGEHAVCLRTAQHPDPAQRLRPQPGRPVLRGGARRPRQCDQQVHQGLGRRSRAFDDNPTTFWKSAPMPDPQAVVVAVPRRARRGRHPQAGRQALHRPGLHRPDAQPVLLLRRHRGHPQALPDHHLPRRGREHRLAGRAGPHRHRPGHRRRLLPLALLDRPTGPPGRLDGPGLGTGLRPHRRATDQSGAAAGDQRPVRRRPSSRCSSTTSAPPSSSCSSTTATATPAPTPLR